MGLTTTFMGLSLPTPLIVASSSLVRSVDGVVAAARAGAGAVVLKSLFEEQFEAEVRAIPPEVREAWHPEAADYVERMNKDLGPEEYLRFVRAAKDAVGIPVIASLNCLTERRWPEYAQRCADAGADAIELNLALLPADPVGEASRLEDAYVRILEEVASRVSLPVAVKIGSSFTSVGRIASRLADHGASALVLFNRFYQFEIDPVRMRVVPGERFSHPSEASTPLRWVSLLYGRVPCDLVGATGIHDGAAVLKFILAGATAVQVASAIYLYGWDRLREMSASVDAWLSTKGFASLDQVRGRLSQVNSPDPGQYERYQYIKVVAGIE